MPEAPEWFHDDEALIAALRSRGGVETDGPSVDGVSDLREMARGGQGIVYVGVETESGRRVAVKRLREDRFAAASDRLRFEREIEIASALDHPGIVRVLRHGRSDDGSRYLVMAYIDGTPLDEYVLGPDRTASLQESDLGGRGGASRTEDLLRLMVQVCDAVQFAHQNGVIHRDLKPSNIRVDRTGAPHVLDFGMALPHGVGEEAIGGTPAGGATMTGQFVGSLGWASPEQVEGRRGGVDVRSDVYSLGAILYQLLTGRLPCSVDGSLADTILNITERPPVPPSRDLELRPDVETIVLRCLAKDPARRYQSVGELGRDVRRHLLGEPIEASRDSTWYRLQSTLSRYRRTSIAAGVASAVLLVLVAAMGVLYFKADRATAQAQASLERERRQTARAEAITSFLESSFRLFEPSPGEGSPSIRLDLDRAVQRMYSELAHQPDALASVAETLGYGYYRLGLYDRAMPLYAQAVLILERRAGESSDTEAEARDRRIALARAYQGDAMLHHAVWKLDQAESRYEAAMDLVDPAHPREREHALSIMSDFAMLRGAQGDLDGAESLLRGVISITEGVPFRAYQHVDALEKLARVLQARRQLDEADHAYDQALERMIELHGHDSLRVHDCKLTTASLRLDQGRYADARTLASETLAAYRRQTGVLHPRCVSALTTIGDSHRKERNLELAEASYREAIEIGHEVFGPSSPFLAPVYFSLGLILEPQDRLDDAVEAYQRSLAAPRDGGSADAVLTARAEGRLGCCLLRLGRRDEASQPLQSAVPALESLVGPEHQEARIARSCLEQLRSDAPAP